MENNEISLNYNTLIHVIGIRFKLFITFWLQKRNTNERLDNVFWFNGTNNDKI
jgi:hypothetical protein